MKAHSISVGRVTNSVDNAIMLASRQPKPLVSMGATLIMWTDRYAATILYVGSKRVIIREDIATRTDQNGQSESQDYTYAPNPVAKNQTFTLRKDGSYVKQGQSVRNGTRLVIGGRDHYIDPSF